MENKSKVSYKYPTINFFDPDSLSTWLEARKIAQEMGMRFNSRLDHISGIYIISSLVLSTMTLLYLGGYFEFLEQIRLEHLVQFFVITFFFIIYCFRAIYPIAMINEETIN